MGNSSIKIYRDKDARLSFLKNKTIAILGYGSQGRAQALCLRDSGMKVIIGLPSDSRSRNTAKRDGFQVFSVKEAVRKGDIIAFLFPDHLHQEVFRDSIRPYLRPGQALIFAAGFSVHFELVKPPKFVDVILVAPHSPGITLRELFLKHKGVPAFLAVKQDFSGQAKRLGLAYSDALGCSKAFVMETSFEREALGDLFGEQAVLCGGLSELVRAGFDTLVKKGLPPENAYLEVVHQLDLLVNLLKDKGVVGMYREISLLAAYGSYKNAKRIITPKTRQAMEKIYSEIKSGQFARQFMRDYRSGLKGFKRFLQSQQYLLIDKTAFRFKKILPR
jgi:ketol-acid reductoisomerase